MGWWNWLQEIDAPSSQTCVTKSVNKIHETFINRADWKKNELLIGNSKAKAILIYLDYTVDQNTLRKDVVEPLLHFSKTTKLPQEWTLSESISCGDLLLVQQRLLEGSVAVFISGSTKCFIIRAPRAVVRAVESPEMEFTTRGPKEGFIEDASQNIEMIQKRLRTDKLELRSFRLGKITQTNTWLLSLKGITSPELIERVTSKLNQITADQMIDSCEVEEYLEDSAWTPFSVINTTERPDRCVGALMEGGIVLLVDGSPNALIGPYTYFQQFHTPDDYYQRAMYATIKRWIRVTGFFLSTNLVALYMALIGFHSHLIPVKLVTILSLKRESVPFPPMIEIMIIQLMIDLVLEGILRLPPKLGQIIGVSGAIIIGQATISADLISPMVIIIVSVSTICGYAQARLSSTFTVQVIRYVNLLCAGILGAFGLTVIWIFWLIHVCSLHSLGKAYLNPISPFSMVALKDTILRISKRAMGNKSPNVM